MKIRTKDHIIEGIVLVLFSVAVLSVGSFFIGAITSYTVLEGGNIYTDDIGIYFDYNTTYTWIP